eukprot:TRINITY_DN11894_c0_g1_i2.p1 TRINITY_DN11894_c0_g1~~TRINITY_DN11894_c0_g1_i2.p1  ORF type:complete len:506 (+),score=86.73 TRINITY_DN11894_c0_g1_i2:75-1592(+)
MLNGYFDTSKAIWRNASSVKKEELFLLDYGYHFHLLNFLREEERTVKEEEHRTTDGPHHMGRMGSMDELTTMLDAHAETQMPMLDRFRGYFLAFVSALLNCFVLPFFSGIKASACLRILWRNSAIVLILAPLIFWESRREGGLALKTRLHFRNSVNILLSGLAEFGWSYFLNLSLLNEGSFTHVQVLLGLQPIFTFVWRALRTGKFSRLGAFLVFILMATILALFYFSPPKALNTSSASGHDELGSLKHNIVHHNVLIDFAPLMSSFCAFLFMILNCDITLCSEFPEFTGTALIYGISAALALVTTIIFEGTYIFSLDRHNGLFGFLNKELALYLLIFASVCGLVVHIVNRATVSIIESRAAAGVQTMRPLIGLIIFDLFGIYEHLNIVTLSCVFAEVIAKWFLMQTIIEGSITLKAHLKKIKSASQLKNPLLDSTNDANVLSQLEKLGRDSRVPEIPMRLSPVPNERPDFLQEIEMVRRNSGAEQEIDERAAFQLNSSGCYSVL